MFVKNLYDSHLHLMATGQRSLGLDLSSLSNINDLQSLVPHPNHFRGDWLVGFGWDERNWSEQRVPSIDEMNVFFPDFPVYFSRSDGHSGLTNSKGAERFKKPSQSLFQENQHFQNLENLPPWTSKELQRFLKESCRVLNLEGFTHVRDLGGDLSQFQQAIELEKKDEFTLHVDWNFPCFKMEDFEQVLHEAQLARDLQTPLNQVQGLKFYFDGSLGSGTALVSKVCCANEAKPLWDISVLSQLFLKTWKAGFEVSVHTIGDEAVDQVVEMSRRLSSQGIVGRLNLEHVEILRPETLQKMKSLHITCHLQPCHWMGDQSWFKKQTEALSKIAFPWEALRRARIPFFFGSDSPIERPSVFRNWEGLEKSAAAGIPPLQGDPWIFHQHPAPRVHGETEIIDQKVLSARLL